MTKVKIHEFDLGIYPRKIWIAITTENKFDGFKELSDMTKEEKFSQITSELLETYKAKNKDYGDSFAKLFEEYGMTYSIIHLQEKINRIKSLQKKSNEVKGETYVDSLKDLANYAILTLIELES